MHQDRDETIRSFGARLLGQASVCKYMINCPDCHHEVNYTEPILQDALSHGIEDSEIQLNLLGNTNQNMSLEEIFHFVEANEAVKKKMLPFQELLKPKNTFYWDTHLNQLLEESSEVIIKEIEEDVQIFNKTKPTCLATDWSKDGIGFWLFQKHCECSSVEPFCCPTGWKITLVGSRFTHPAESRYALIEEEALAVADKTRHFVLGCHNLIIAVDHKPVLKIFGDRAFDNIPNIHLRNLKEKTLRYKFRMYHIPRTKNSGPDVISHYPVGDKNADMIRLPDGIAAVQTSNSIQSPVDTVKPSFGNLPHPLVSAICCIESNTDELETEVQLAAISRLETLQSVTWGAKFVSILPVMKTCENW